MKIRKAALYAAAAALCALCAAFSLWKNGFGGLESVEARLFSWPRSAVVRDRFGGVLGVMASEDGEYCLPIRLSDMGKWMPLIAVEVEDRRFWSHGGVDAPGLLRAARDNFLSRRVASGASTITSQVIRLCRPAERTVWTKLREFSQATRLEKVMTKDEILEFYLNTVPLGGTLRGVEAASRAWFERSARDLTIAQAALLAVMIKGPTAYRPDMHPETARRRRDWAISMLRERGKISAEQARSAMAEPLPKRLNPLPRDELIFCGKVLSMTAEKDVVSTLDRSAQRILRAALLEALAGQHADVTAAGVLMENATGAIRACVPNARWGTRSAAEWVDCASALRSPGSALKPFVYAMAFEDGALTPSSLMADTPLTLSGRAPRNFDRIYRGPVSAGSALADSLNVPAVRVLRMEGGERFLQKLRLLGFDSLTRGADYYGDSLVLGGCEVSPLQLCAASGALARLGQFVQPRFLRDEPRTERAVFSPQSAWITTNVLSDPARMPTLLRAAEGARMAFKTGTSYGLRDAWTAAWNDEWSLVVWLGDPSGEPHPELVGLGTAAPAALKVLRALGGDFSAPPPGVSRREVCSLSGQPPSPLCPRTVGEFYIPGVSNAARCPMHRTEAGKTVVVWPPELSSFMESPREKRTDLSISSPLDGASYLMHENGARLILRAEGAEEFFWFADGRFVGRGKPERPCSWPMERGRHRISVMDSLGRQKTVEFSVYTLDKNPSDELPELLPVE